MSRGKSLIKNTGILMVAKISTQLVSFLLLPLYTTILSTQEYGEIDIYTSLVMIIIPFLTLQLEMGLFRFFITEKSEIQRKQIITTVFSIVTFILFCISIIYWFIAIGVELKYRTYLYFYYVTIVISTVLLQVCRAYGNNKAYGMASFLSSSLAICFNVVFIAGLRWKVEGILLSSIIAQTVSCIYILCNTKVYRYVHKDYFSKNQCKILLKYSVPLVFNQISSWAINYSDRVIILNIWGASSNGIYSIANKFSNITNTFYNIFNIAWTENVVRSLEDKDNQIYINKIFMLIFNLYLILITGIINLLPFFFSIMINSRYNTAYGHIPILLLAMFFSGMAATIGSIYIAYNRTKEVSITTIIAGISNIVIHIFLLNKCGLYAASISTLFSFGILFVYRFIFVQKFFKLNFNIFRVIPQLLIFIFAWIAYNDGNFVIVIIGLILNLFFIGLLFFRNKHDILYLIKK